MFQGSLGARARIVGAGTVTAVVLGTLAWFWQASLLPETYSVTGMGYADHGGGRAPAAHAHGDDARRGDPALAVPALVADPNRRADVRVTLVARQEPFRLPSGREVDGYTLNGTSPGPVIRAVAGQLVEIRLVNESVRDGTALHWHGVDVPNAMDGVAGVTQDAVGVGGQFTYRFVADRPGTYWYHAHQASREQVRRGLLGALVVTPPPSVEPNPEEPAQDVVALVHLYDGTRTINGREGDVRVAAPPGRRVRVRVINTENGLIAAWVSGAPFHLLAIDGTDVRNPTPVRDKAVLITAGGRADLEVVMPPGGVPVRVQLGDSHGLVLGSSSYAAPATPQPAPAVDPLSYGTAAPLGFDPQAADRRFRYDIGRRPGFVDGRPGLWWTVNGRTFPDLPAYVVTEHDVVRMRITNDSGEAHPMHLHGHHVVVLARDGVAATGSPWWVDSLEVGQGESYDIAFEADNPGIWMDHCHNLPHAGEGLVVHLMYDGVTTPFAVGDDAGNDPE